MANNNTLAGVDWDGLISSLKAEKCILFIGEGVYQAPGGGSINTALRTKLNIGPDNRYIRLYDEDGFFLFHKPRYKREVTEQIRSFFNQDFPETEELFSKIAALPLPMVINLTFDNVLNRTFDKLGFPYDFDFYFRNRPAPKTFKQPESKQPMLYSLLGNIEEPESILLTHSDFFEYLESIFKAKSMHAEMLSFLEEAEHLIFLGLPYEKWYFQLLLRIFSLHSVKLYQVERLALKEFENDNLHTLYQEEFKIEFFPVDVQPFVEELYRQCQKEGILKAAPGPDVALAGLPDLNLGEFGHFISNNEVDDAFRHLDAFLQRHKPGMINQINNLMVLKNRLSLLTQREVKGIIYEEDRKVERNQIIHSLMDLATEVLPE